VIKMEIAETGVVSLNQPSMKDMEYARTSYSSSISVPPSSFAKSG